MTLIRSALVKKTYYNRYIAIIEKIFADHYVLGHKEFEFKWDEFKQSARQLEIRLPKNIRDVFLSFLYQKDLPDSIQVTADKGFIWIIEGAGKFRYRFRQFNVSLITPTYNLIRLKIIDNTPQIIKIHAQSSEQILLAKIRYNNLIGIFFGISAFSLQTSFKTMITNIGQIEINEIYIGTDLRGRHFVIPLQAEGANEYCDVVQIQNNIACCKEKFPTLICLPVLGQFISEDCIALFELAVEEDKPIILKQCHYQLVPVSEMFIDDLS